jgi:hypothetical protein
MRKHYTSRHTTLNRVFEFNPRGLNHDELMAAAQKLLDMGLFTRAGYAAKIAMERTGNPKQVQAAGDLAVKAYSRMPVSYHSMSQMEDICRILGREAEQKAAREIIFALGIGGDIGEKILRRRIGEFRALPAIAALIAETPQSTPPHMGIRN